MTRDKLDVDAGYIVEQYGRGKSVKALAEELGISRGAVTLRLKRAGITPRNRSEAMFQRMANTPPEERSRLAAAAHEAVRGRRRSVSERRKGAMTRTRRVGVFEPEFASLFESHGFEVDCQHPFLGYNIDVACGNVFVEVHVKTSSPLAGASRRKLVDCVHAGANMLYIWISPRNKSVPDACYEKAVSIAKLASADPSLAGQYWVIRSTGELYASGSAHRDGITLVEPAVAALDAS